MGQVMEGMQVRCEETEPVHIQKTGEHKVDVKKKGLDEQHNKNQ